VRYIIILLVWIIQFQPIAAFTQVLSNAIENRLRELLAAEKLSGAVISVLKADSVQVLGMGVKNMHTGEKMTGQEKVHVGSITKTLLALGVLRMVTENKLQLDDPVHQYLPGLPFDNPWEKEQPITIRHLLDHTAGLSDLRLWHFFSTGSTPDTPLESFYRSNPGVLKIYSKPGSVFSYSNMGYTLIGMVIEAIAKERYERYLDSVLLKPLGMQQSSFQFYSQTGADAVSELAMGHFDNGEMAPAMPIFLRPAGQFTTTGEDMVCIINLLLNKGVINGEQFIRKDLIDQIGKQAQTVAAVNGLPNGYALGAVSRDRHGVVGIAHSGNIIGYKAMLYVFPNRGKGFFIACNMDSESADYERLNRMLIAGLSMDSEILPTMASLHPRKASKKWVGYYAPVIPKVEPFQLLERISSFTHVSIDNGTLSLQPFQKKAIQLLTNDNRLFIADGRVGYSHLFYENEAREKFLTTGTQTFKKVNGIQIILPMISISMGLLSLISLLLLGTIQLIKNPATFQQQAYSFSYYAAWLLLIGGLLAASKGIVYLGDKNTATVLLYAASIALPVSCAFSIFQYYRQPGNPFKKIDFWVLVFLSQCCLLLGMNGMLPFATWS
jgi:CubicO group peptidase (beta-lactamase class C family)